MSLEEIIIEEGSKRAISIKRTEDLSVDVKKAAEAELIIEEEGSGHLTLTMAEDASLRVFLVSSVKEGESHSLKAQVKLAPKAKLHFHDIHLSKGSYGLDMQVSLLGMRSSFSYGGLHFLNGTAKSKSELLINHEASHTVSKQSFRGLYDDVCSGLFTGIVEVLKDAKDCEAQQLYKAVVLSDQAEALVRPQLEINNRHIKASHGASIGQLDEEALFYLCSRGLSRNEAKALLVQSMAESILETFGESEISRVLRKSVITHIKNSLVV